MTTTRILTLSLAGLLLAAGAHAQTLPPMPDAQLAGTARQSIYVELLGNGVIYSINYDRQIRPEVVARAGAMLFSDDEASAVMAPVTATYLIGRGAHRLEAGGGLVFGVVTQGEATDRMRDVAPEQSSTLGVVGTAVLGYRHQPFGDGLVFRAAFTPLVTPRVFIPWFGVSVGYGF